MTTNTRLVLICGDSGSGKSASLRNIKDPSGVMYLNCESGKDLPFASKFQPYTITDPIQQIYRGFDAAEGKSSVHTIVIDSLTFMMEMVESVNVLTASNTMAAWGEYQQFFKNLMQNYVAKSTKNVIFTAHVMSIMNDSDMTLETKVPVKGALKNNGIEAYFSTVVMARKVGIEQLADQKSDMLTITAEEEMLGFKYVYQTRLTKDTVHSRVRSPMGMWKPEETFIDNDSQILMDKLHEYYS